MRTGHWILLACTVVFPAWPGLAGAASSNSDRTAEIAVRVFNYANVSARSMGETRATARRILAKAGVQLVWRECPIDPEQRAGDSSCAARLGPGEVAVRVMPRFGGRKGLLQLGQAAGQMVELYWDKVERMAEKGAVGPEVLAGCALVHELGHLLLKTTEHSKRGLMATAWDRNVMRQAERGQLLFDDAEACALRSGCLKKSRVVSGE